MDITNEEVSKSIQTASLAIHTKELAKTMWDGDEKFIELLECLSK